MNENRILVGGEDLTVGTRRLVVCAGRTEPLKEAEPSGKFSEPFRSAHKKDGGSLAGETVGVFGFSGASGSAHFIHFNR